MIPGIMAWRPNGPQYGPELVVNGTFAAGSSNWQVDSPWSIVSGQARSNGCDRFEQLRQDTGDGFAGFVGGKTYLLSFDVSNYSGAAGEFLAGSAGNLLISGNGNYTQELTPASNVNYFLFQARNSGTLFYARIDNVSIKEVF